MTSPAPVPLVAVQGHLLLMLAAVEQFKRTGTVPGGKP